MPSWGSSSHSSAGRSPCQRIANDSRPDRRRQVVHLPPLAQPAPPARSGSAPDPSVDLLDQVGAHGEEQRRRARRAWPASTSVGQRRRARPAGPGRRRRSARTSAGRPWLAGGVEQVGDGGQGRRGRAARPSASASALERRHQRRDRRDRGPRGLARRGSAASASPGRPARRRARRPSSSRRSRAHASSGNPIWSRARATTRSVAVEEQEPGAGGDRLAEPAVGHLDAGAAAAVGRPARRDLLGRRELGRVDGPLGAVERRRRPAAWRCGRAGTAARLARRPSAHVTAAARTGSASPASTTSPRVARVGRGRQREAAG